MVALKLEQSDPVTDESIDPMKGREYPRLTLLENGPVSPRIKVRPQAKHTPVHRSKRSRWEQLWFSAAAVVVLLFLLINGADALWRVSSTADALNASTPVVKVTVHPGDTLWKYAAQYGSPDSYILDRVESIARVNHLSSTAELTPGQHLNVPVTNPVVLAQLQRGRETPVALLAH